jgi:hypothetical protein
MRPPGRQRRMRGDLRVARDVSRWRSPFASWVRGYGTRRLVHQLTRRGCPVTQLAVYHWVAGRCSPRADHALAIVSASRGRLRLEDVYASRRRAQTHAPETAAPMRRGASRRG